MITGINNIGVAVSDLEVSVAFFSQLGFEEIGRDETPGIMLQAGSALLYLFQTDSVAQSSRRASDLVHNSPGFDHISLDVADVDDFYDHHRDQVAFEAQPKDQPWGYRATSIVDPDGNRVFFLSQLKGT